VKKAVILVVILAAIVGWHVYVCTSMQNDYYEVNWLTDVATVKLPSAASSGISDSAGVAAFNWGRNLTGVAGAEQQLNLYSRRYMDMYAIFVPYRVAIVDKPAEHSKATSSPIQLPHSAPLDTHIFDVAELRSGFLDNEPRASALHKGTIMFVKGVTGKLLTNRDTGDHVIMVHDQNAHESFLACRMTDRDLSVLAERNDPGTIVVLSGECRGWVDGALWFKHCQLEQVVR
jgi:hypothetical protein